eukprot:TRINITY_DN65725_c0_g1_i1.p1 TRINITY_DN65725_c0_g1~~TRINITY_DN65725_c0_g1_i1.p1  ORF type:complete len:636 (-),score=103.99 TRINITY_DN65725_c0_g1_i1:179-2086(-)
MSGFVVDASDESECCVCYGCTTEKTRCGHCLCNNCLQLLPRPECPLCRRALHAGAANAASRAGATTASVRGGPLSARLRTRAAATRPRQRLPLAQPALSARDTVAVLGDGVAPSEGGVGASRSSARTGPSPRRPGAGGQSPFLDWLRRRDEAAAAAEGGSDGGSAVAQLLPPLPSPSQAGSAAPLHGGAEEAVSRTPRQLLQARAAPQAVGLRIADLVTRFGRMSFQEAPRFVRHLAWLYETGLVAPGDRSGAALCQSLQRRLADLISTAPLGAFAALGDVVSSLESVLQATPDHDGRERSRSRSNCCESLRRALEARLTYLLYNPSLSTAGAAADAATVASADVEHGANEGAGGLSGLGANASIDDGSAGRSKQMSLEELQQICACVLELRSHGLVGPQLRTACLAHARQSLQRSPLSRLILHIRTVAMLLALETGLQATLVARLVRTLGTAGDTSVKQLDAVVRLLLALEDCGVRLLDLSDGPSLEVALLRHLRNVMMSSRPERLAVLLDNPNGGLPHLCGARQIVAEAVRVTLSERLVRAVEQVCETLNQAEDLERVRAELVAWEKCIRRASAVGVVELDSPTRAAIVAAITKCTARCMWLPQFKCNMNEVQDMEWSIVALVGGIAARSEFS